ncbi:MAG: N-acetyltransferase family protein [Mycobacterium leprae]
MSFTIRPFVPADYEATAHTGTLAYEFPLDVEQMRYDDEHRDPRCKHAWWSAEVDGQLVGGAGYFQFLGSYHPRKFVLDGWVSPAYQGSGIGRALFETVMAGLEPFEPLSVRASAREHMPWSIRFLTQRGFTEAMRSWESVIDLTGFTPTLYGETPPPGVTIASYAALRQTEPDLERRVYDLVTTTRLDMPSHQPLTTMEFEAWREKILSDPYFMPEAYFIAIQGDRYVGLSTLWRTAEQGKLHTGFTGVRRECRGGGIALALKVHALAWAKQQGYKEVETFNATTNGPMLHINERLGFVRQPAWIEYIKVLRSE